MLQFLILTLTILSPYRSQERRDEEIVENAPAKSKAWSLQQFVRPNQGKLQSNQGTRHAAINMPCLSALKGLTNPRIGQLCEKGAVRFAQIELKEKVI